MRKTIMMLLLPLLLCACGGSKTNQSESGDSTEQTANTTKTLEFYKFVAERGDEWLTQLGHSAYYQGLNKDELIASIVEVNPGVDKKAVQDYINKNWSKIEEIIINCEKREYGDAVVTDSIVEEAPAVEAPAPQENYGYGRIGDDGRPDPSGVYLIVDKVNERYVLTINKDKTASLCRERDYNTGRNTIYGSYTPLNYLGYWPMLYFSLSEMKNNTPIVFYDEQSLPAQQMTLYEGKLYYGHREAKAKDPNKTVKISRYK